MDVSSEPELRGRRLSVTLAPRDASAEGDQDAGTEHGGRRYLRPRAVASLGQSTLLSFAVFLACETREPASPSKSAAARSVPAASSSSTTASAPESSAVSPAVATAPAAVSAAPAADSPSAAPAAIGCLVRLYGGTAHQRDGKWYLETSSGVSIPYDDGRTKSFDEQLGSPDVEDAFRDRYRRGPLVPVTRKDFDPGRSRLAPVFTATYGATAADVQRALVPVRLVSGTVSVHERAAVALRRVAARLEKVVVDHPEWKGFFEPLGGGFNWRTVAGTELQSAHSFGVAVDLNPKLGAYWRWQKEWKNQVPAMVVDAFESEGFAWGGRWFHFDTMHFEYRPELFDEGCYGNAVVAR